MDLDLKGLFETPYRQYPVVIQNGSTTVVQAFQANRDL